MFTPMVATVMAHFTRRRTLALGLGFCSIGLSSFAFNPLFQLLVEKYAWRGALLILGGLSLNLVPCGALIRPQQQSESPEEKVGQNRAPSLCNTAHHKVKITQYHCECKFKPTLKPD